MKKYPLLVLPHGGQQAATLAVFSDWSQYLAAHGFVVFEPNYRESDNLGEKYMGAMSFILYNALKERGVETKFVTFRANSHFPGDPVQTEDVLRRMAEWLVAHNK